jgi:protein-S-isoprenylcysteine O-methyltransferase Ste14
MQTYYLTGGWFWIPFLLLLSEAVFILVWAILSLPIKQRGKKLSTKGVYSFVRHPIYTTIVFHFNILCSLWLGSYILLISIPAQYLLWSKAVVFEEQYLVGIFGQEYLDYMSRVSRFLPWR